MNTARDVLDDAMIYGVPEPGQLVEVRLSQWIVTDVIGSGIENDRYKQQHLAKLTSIDEDGLRKVIEVIWQIEPGAYIIARQGLPSISGVVDADRLETFLDAVRWGEATHADRNYHLITQYLIE